MSSFMQATTNLGTYLTSSFSVCWIDVVVVFCSCFRKGVQRLVSFDLLTYLLPDEPAFLNHCIVKSSHLISSVTSCCSSLVPPLSRSSGRYSHVFHANSSPRCIHSSGGIILNTSLLQASTPRRAWRVCLLFQGLNKVQSPLRAGNRCIQEL
jgi:hypothetical protein